MIRKGTLSTETKNFVWWCENNHVPWTKVKQKTNNSEWRETSLIDCLFCLFHFFLFICNKSKPIRLTSYIKMTIQAQQLLARVVGVCWKHIFLNWSLLYQCWFYAKLRCKELTFLELHIRKGARYWRIFVGLDGSCYCWFRLSLHTHTHTKEHFCLFIHKRIWICKKMCCFYFLALNLSFT